MEYSFPPWPTAPAWLQSPPNDDPHRARRRLHNLSDCNFLLEVRTAPGYRLFLMGGGSYPGMIRADYNGACIAGELYYVPDARVQEIFAREPPHLYLGEVELEDGSHVQGVLCDPDVAPQHPEITGYGGWRGWRKYLETVA